MHGLCRYVVVLYLTLASLQREKIPCVKIFYPDKDFSLGHLHGRLLVQTTDRGNNSFLDLKIETEEGEMAQQLGTPAALAEDFSSIPSTRVGTQPLNSSPWGPMPSSVLCRHCTQASSQNHIKLGGGGVVLKEKQRKGREVKKEEKLWASRLQLTHLNLGPLKR